MKSAGSHCGCEEEDDKKNNNTFSSVSAFKRRGRERVHRSTLAPPVFVSHTAVCAWTYVPIYVSVLLPLYTLTPNLGGPKVSQWPSSAVTNSSEVTEVSPLTSDTEA